MLLSKRAKSKGQAILFPKSNRLGMALVVENHPTPWPWKRLGACWWLKSFWLTLPMLLPNPSTPALGTAEPSLLKDHKQSYQIKYYSFSSLCLSLNSWMRFLSLSGLASTFARDREISRFIFSSAWRHPSFFSSPLSCTLSETWQPILWRGWDSLRYPAERHPQTI